MILLTFLCYFRTYIINSTHISTVLPDIGLIHGATYDLSITNTNSETFFIAILDSKEYSMTPHLSYSYASQFCSRVKNHISRINSSIVIHKNYGSLSITIPKSDTYRTLIISCKSQASQYTVDVSFSNGDSLLDSRRLPSFISIPIELCITFVCFMPWLLNQYKYRSFRHSLHNLISLGMIFTFLNLYLCYLVLWNDSIHDRKNFVHYFEITTRVLSSILILSAIILATKGWFIVFQDLKSKDVTDVITFCSIYFILRSLSSTNSTTVFDIILFVLTSILLIFLFSSLIFGIQFVDRHIIAHMYVIQRAGINPITTPIYKKHIIYTLFKHILVIYFSYCIAIMSLELADVLNFWVKDMLNVIEHVGILVALSVLFCVRKVDCDLYSKIDDSESAKAVSSQTLDDFEINSYEDYTDLIDWEEGMRLPPQPVIVKNEEERKEDKADFFNITEL
ncbi:hypothetical protein M9Y10_008947 [Tritrichomonas musculus]|uniref:Intimal thickness related receptor IRP domain-containing protein n=1 Tax=Tritrichomonas musculus TaxID=1915356 RepID=A0ABR2J0K2_9EUKA